MRFMNNKGSQGFTLLELMLVLGIVGIISTFVISIASSVRNMSSVTETKSRMIEIAAKAKSYYRGHEALPGPGGTLPTAGTDARALGNGQVPTQAANFDLEQKYRLDSWGQFLTYILVMQDQDLTNTTDDTDILDIDHLIIDGKNVAGVIISGGPNQTIDTVGQDLVLTGDGVAETYTTTGDDIVVPINVSKEAMDIALEELKVLQDKVNAFDALYEGFNNDSDDEIDESGCVAMTSAFISCPSSPPTSYTPSDAFSDPNCGTMTLDNINENGTSVYGGCASVAGAGDVINYFVTSLYILQAGYSTDPWGNEYLWGCDNTICTSGSALAPAYASSDRRYHTFFSSGPNGTADDNDDIIP